MIDYCAVGMDSTNCEDCGACETGANKIRRDIK